MTFQALWQQVDIVALTTVVVGAIVWLIRLEAAVRGNSKEIERLARTHNECRADVVAHREALELSVGSKIETLIASMSRLEGSMDVLLRRNGVKSGGVPCQPDNESRTPS